ncbi:uncharacterized protein FTOL_00121 [Fusarium torulosum]|uniref:Uncharacterized protein n=1 Tax=Fusarium torulosum TaxID=33205 RepID=A0AAE8SBZ6_9HYPO|nr:uncharacterized protein FTOL_00121 [Fusarium torulosum]
MASAQGAGQPPHNSNDQNKCAPSQTTENHIRDNVVRLLFELLRNADAKAYSECAARKESPFVTFKIYPKQIIVDCNEDGLTKLDLDAICRLDTKAASFKSILIASKKMHIQSGYFSFEFEHNGDETGSKKMKPVWVAPVDDVPEALTRMTLYLHDQGDDKDLKCLRGTLLSQFEQLSGTSLLFLKKLQRITVEFYNTDGKLQKSKHFRKEKLDDCRVSIEGISIIEGRQATDSKIYHVAEQPAESLATSVVLAFPLDKDYKPMARHEKKEVFNILPITLTKYNFHIYADFDLESDRKNLVATSKRNLELRELIVDAFHNALDSFWRHPTLCYDWPMFLPSPEKNHEVFWDGLDTAFRKKSNYIVVECRRDSMRTMKDAMFLPDSMKDKDGQPLLEDANNDLFLSSSYSKSAVEALMNHGLNTTGFDAFVALLEDDLKRENSKMKAKETTVEWHSQMADLLSNFAKRGPSHTKILRGLPLLPLMNGKWVSFSFGPVYFSTVLACEIPLCLDIQIMSQVPCRNASRYVLFQRLGVTVATVDQVRDLCATRLDSPRDLSIEDLVCCLRFLYLTHKARDDYQQKQQYYKVQVMDMDLRRIKPPLKAIYLTGTYHQYSPESLLPVDKFPSFFLHRTISEAGSSYTRILAPIWKNWLCRSIRVRRDLSLLPEIGVKPFEILENIYKFRPDKFLGFLKYRWGCEGPQLEKYQALVLFLRDFPAKDICVGDFPVMLKNTWLPDRDLEMVVKRYVDDLSYFPFLKIEMDDTSQSMKVEWEFLTKKILAKKDQDMELFIELVESMKRLCLKDVSDSQFRSVVNLYSEIDTMLTDSRKKRNERAIEFFDDSGILYIDDDGPLWTGSSSCLWAAPPDMITSYSLKSFFTQRACNPQQMETLERLFHKRMSIRNATLDDVVDELTELRSAKCEDVSRIVGIYQYLDEKIDASSELRIAFQDSPLLFQISDGCSTWKKTADFVWVHDEAGTELATAYTKLKRFFILKLGVKASTEELLKSPPKSIEEAKEILPVLNAAQGIEMLWLHTNKICEKIMFPVRYPDGRVLLENHHSNFLIGDHEGLKVRLKNKIKLLDLELCEVHRLTSLFWKMSLNVRYLSKEIIESTSMVAIDESPVLLGRRDLRHKAYQITRIAANYSSPRYLNNKSAFYQQLRTMRTIESDQISSTLKLYQGSDVIQSEAVLGTACAHIAESGRELTVYVPKNAKAQEICYISRLPKAFAEWLEPSVHTQEQVVKALTLVFATEKAMLDDILDDQGIMQLSFEDEDAIESEVSDGEEEYYDIEEPKISNGHASDLQDDGKDTRKAAFPQQRVFDFNDLQSALPNLEKADKSLPGKVGLSENDLKSQK